MRKKTRTVKKSINISLAHKKVLDVMLKYFGSDPDEPITEAEIVKDWAIRGMLASWRETSTLMDRIEKDPNIELTPKMIRLALKDPEFKHDVDAIDFVLTDMKSKPLFADLLQEVEKEKHNDGSSGSSPLDPVSKFLLSRQAHQLDEVIVLYKTSEVFKTN